MGRATYLYCVVQAARKPSVTGAPKGLSGSTAVACLPVGGSLWLVAGTVPLEKYGPGKLEAALGDLEWVGGIALAHEEMVEHFTKLKGVTVVPMKLFTMFTTPERAVADITARRAPIEAAMKRIAGAEEWGIRVMRDRAPIEAPASSRKVSSGAAFLAAKKEKRDSARMVRLMAAEAALAAFERLAGLASDARRREDPPAAGATPPLLDAAFLVPVKRRTEFKDLARKEAEACARAGAAMTLSGPWPAYNFIDSAAAR